MNNIRSSFLFIFSFFFILTLHSQNELQNPTNFFNYTYGEKMPTFYEVHSYFHYLEENSPSLKIVSYGKSYEGRPLEVAILSTPEYLENLNSIKEEHKKTLHNNLPNITDNPLILWLSHGVHGNEAGATVASPETAYSLLTSHREILQDAVIIIDPNLNPDGFSRFTQWYKQEASHPPQSRREVIQHHEPWPSGRVNHYQFDLNRDWAWATQKETKARLSIYHDWKPHVHIDFHEQFPDNPYYFAPAAEPIHPRISSFQREIQDSIGKANASVFDSKNWLYFTGEYFDLYYPSYGDTYPLFNGAIGLTYEQGGHGISGVSINLKNGDTLRLQDRIQHHRQTAITTLERCIELKNSIHDAWNSYFHSARNNIGSEIESYALICESNSQRKRLKEFFQYHNIESTFIPEGIELRGFSYKENKKISQKTNSHSLIINCNQVQGHLIHVLMEPENNLSKVKTYDITAWAIPYLWNIDAVALKTTPSFTPMNDKVETTTDNENHKKILAYKREYKTFSDMKDVAQLIKRGIDVRSFKSPDKNPLFLVLKADNKNIKLNKVMSDWEPIYNGRSLKYDLGSDKYKLVKKPKVLLPQSDQVDPYNYGFIWHYFERELEYPLFRVRMKNLSDVMADYNTIIFPDGNYSFDSIELIKLQDWMESGGNAIFIGNAYKLVSSIDKVKLTQKTSTSSSDSEVIPYLEQIKSDTSKQNPGSIVRIKWDNEAPLGWGMDTTLDCLILGNSAYNYLEGGVQVGYIDQWRMDRGFIGSDVKNQLLKTTRFSYKGIREGKVIYMLDDPLFRGFWEAGKQLFANAIILM